jgi:hypothetical protein
MLQHERPMPFRLILVHRNGAVELSKESAINYQIMIKRGAVLVVERGVPYRRRLCRCRLCARAQHGIHGTCSPTPG